KSLTEELVWETKRREAVEKLAVDAFKRRRELEEQLAKTQPPASPPESSIVQPSRAGHGQVLQGVKRLTETLAEEIKRRQGAEQQTGEIEKKRRELESQLGQLRQELNAAQGLLQEQKESSGVEQSRLQGRTQELQAAQVEVEQQVKRLTESLAEQT